MHIIRTIVWVLLLVAFVIFAMANWEPGITVRIWQNLVVETKLPAVMILSFLIGLVPMWLIHRATRWTLQRRVNALENAARNAAMAAPPPSPPPPPATTPDPSSAESAPLP
jgi:uncharacterized membrane protein